MTGVAGRWDAALRRVSRALAVAGPLAVWLLAYEGLMAWRDEADENAARNAGRIFNAQVIDGGAAVAMDKLLARRDPQVIVLGPSYANTDVKPELLAARLGISKDEIALMSVPNSVGSHWYAILKYRVFDPGYRPKLVLVVSGLQSMLLTTPLTESSFVNLEVQLPDAGDPRIDAKVAQSATGLRWARLREQRGKVRAAWFDLLRDGPLTAFTALTPGQIRFALGGVFDDSRIDMRLYGASTPVVDANRGPTRFYNEELLPTPDDSFIGDVTRLATEHGARIVWLRPPMSPHIPDELDDVVLPGVQERTIALVEESGGSFVDMRDLPMTSQMFKNEDHMNVEGQRRFSEAIGKALLDLDALHPDAGPGGLPPLAPIVTVDGGPSGWVAPGDGVWVPPGATMRWTIDGWPPVRGTFAAEVMVERAGDIDGVVATVDDAQMWLRAEATDEVGRGYGRIDAAETPPGAFSVAVSAPDGGPPVRIAAIALGRKLRRTFVVGDAGELQGRALRLSAADARGIHPTYSKPPIHVPGENRPLVDLPDEVAAYDTERWSILSDEALMGETALGARCSPFRVAEDGLMLPIPNVPCGEVARKGHGRSCHTTDRMFFTAPDGSDPALNGRKYQIVLDPARRCAGAAWVYPVDDVSVAFPAGGMAELTDGARWFTLSAKYVNYREATLVVRLRVDGALVLDTAIDGRELRQGPRRWRLDPPVPATARDVVVELQSRDYVFYLLDELSLSERAPVVE